VSKLANDVDFAIGLGAVRDLLQKQGIDPAEVGKLHRIDKVRVYQGLAKIDRFDEEGKVVGQTLEVQDLMSVMLSPAWEDGPEWPVIKPGPSFNLPRLKATKTKSTEWNQCVVLPDMQIGYYFDRNENLVSTHDTDAIDLSLKLISDIRPELIVMVGDNLDLPEMGKYRLAPAFQRTVQPALDYATELMFRMRAAAPEARIVWIAGNHEERLVNYILDNAAAAFALRQGARPDGWPVLSVPHLCRLDESSIMYLEGYPANDFWINERLRVIHGDRVKSSGSTAHVYLTEHKTSVIYGHIHRREWAERTFVKWDGPKTIMAASPGCLAKTDGSAPSTKGSLDLHGRPMTVVENWQQGIAVVTYEDTGEHRFFYTQVPFHSGTTEFRGSIYSV
jgi:predicted phosphodiesterase